IVIVSLLKVLPSILMVSSPIVSFVFNKRKTSELLNSANCNKPVTRALYSLVAIFQYLKKEKKFPFSIVEAGCFFSFNKKISNTLMMPGKNARVKSALYSPG